MDRKLAAILAADVVGYSALMETDEAGTFERLKAGRKELFEPEINKHHGRIFKLMGDGLLAEFGSVVDAVECAVTLQRGMVERNANVPKDKRIDVRIGINLGEVIVEGDDRYGEGVNVAARLQELADPGGICVSGKVSREVEKKLAFGFEPMGEQRMKNIAEPVACYRVSLQHLPFGRPAASFRADLTIDAARKRGLARKWPGFAAAAFLLAVGSGAVGWLRPWEPAIEPASIARMMLPLPDKPSIAVLPFTNMSNDHEQDFFADGITEDLITELSKVSGLFVIARNTSFTYKGKPVKIAQVAEELGVHYVLEGSVQRAGDQVRINAQLIDALNGGHVWADRFDGSIADVFALQDKVTNSTADALAVRLTPTQQAAIIMKDTAVPSAYDQFLRGWSYYRQTTPEDYAKAVPLFEKAIELDPTYDKAYAALALVYVSSSARSWTGSLGISAMEARARAQKYLKVAQRRPNSLTHQVVGTLLLQRGVTLESIAEFKQAIALDPSDSWSYALASVALSVANQPDEAIVYINTAARLDPRPPPLFLYYLGFAQFNLEQFDAAAKTLERATRLNPDDEYSFLALAAAYGHLGRKQDAVAAVTRHNQLAIQHGGVPVTIAAVMRFSYCYCGAKSEVVGNRLSEGLRIAEVPEYLDRGKFVEMNQLTADEIRSLMFGHRLHGRSLSSGEERSASLTMQGIASFAGDWVSASVASTLGIPEFKNNELCIAFDVASYCGAVIRNPGGTKARENEFIWRQYTFSRVD